MSLLSRNLQFSGKDWTIPVVKVKAICGETSRESQTRATWCQTKEKENFWNIRSSGVLVGTSGSGKDIPGRKQHGERNMNMIGKTSSYSVWMQ